MSFIFIVKQLNLTKMKIQFMQLFILPMLVLLAKPAFAQKLENSSVTPLAKTSLKA